MKGKHLDYLGKWRLQFITKALVFLDFFLGGGHWSLWYCGICQFFVQYFGNFYLELRYSPNLRIFPTISSRSWSFRKQAETTLFCQTFFYLQFDCFNNQFKVLSVLSRYHSSFLPQCSHSHLQFHQLCKICGIFRIFLW